MAWQIDPAHSQVTFSVKHMMISKVRGAFQEFSGIVNLDDQDLSKSDVEFTIQVASVTTRNEQRDGHLKSPDFFDAAQYPTILFKSTQVAAAGKGHYKVTGDVTMKGVTRSETFDVEAEGPGKDPFGNHRWGFTVTGNLDRKNYNLAWNVALETGGVMVGDTIKIELEVEVMQPVVAPDAAVAGATA
ncbi:MAG: YceI family protein [Chloroflexota bacterium]|nr:YceI family protein [Chloroflexota bacterium]